MHSKFMMGVTYLVSFLNWRSNYVRKRWIGVDNGLLEGKVAVFVHFDKYGKIHDYVIYYLEQLIAAGYRIVFVTNAPKLPAESLATVRGLASLVLWRRNVGYDFGAYKDGILAIPDLDRVDQLIIANDSVYGPFFPFEQILSKIDPTQAQIWGLTDNWDIAYHVQSYFAVFTREAIMHPAFRKFWRRLRHISSKIYVIRQYEVGMSRQLRQKGLRCAALFPYRQAADEIVMAVHGGILENEQVNEIHKEYLLRTFKAIIAGAPLNATHFLWDVLIVKRGFPFLKREVLSANPQAVPNVIRWRDIIGCVSDYNTDYILRHLEDNLRDRFV